jgi:hypothetical protein
LQWWKRGSNLLLILEILSFSFMVIEFGSKGSLDVDLLAVISLRNHSSIVASQSVASHAEEVAEPAQIPPSSCLPISQQASAAD